MKGKATVLGLTGLVLMVMGVGMLIQQHIMPSELTLIELVVVVLLAIGLSAVISMLALNIWGKK